MPDDQEQKVEMEIFFKGGHEIVLSNGETFKIPRLTWGKEAKVIRALGGLINKVPSLRDVKLDKLSGSDILKVFPTIMEIAPDYLSDIVVHLSGEDISWVRDNLDIQDVVNIIYPFFPRIGKLLSQSNLVDVTDPLKPVESPT